MRGKGIGETKRETYTETSVCIKTAERDTAVTSVIALLSPAILKV